MQTLFPAPKVSAHPQTEIIFHGWVHCPRMQAKAAAAMIRQLAAKNGLSSEMPLIKEGVLACTIDLEFTAYNSQDIHPFMIAWEQECRDNGWRWGRSSAVDILRKIPVS